MLIARLRAPRASIFVAARLDETEDHAARPRNLGSPIDTRQCGRLWRASRFPWEGLVPLVGCMNTRDLVVDDRAVKQG
jgi:hypothetical protein